MWDKKNKFKLVYSGVKGAMPEECTIDKDDDNNIVQPDEEMILVVVVQI